MKAIFKIEEYLPETHQIVVRFARLHAPKLIDEYRAVAVDYSKLDCRDVESFTQSLMRRVGDDQIKIHEENEPIKNKAVHPKAMKPFFIFVSAPQISRKKAPIIIPII